MVNPVGLDEGYDDMPWSTMDNHELRSWFPQQRFDFIDDEYQDSPPISVLDVGFQQQVLNRNKRLQYDSVQNTTLQLQRKEQNLKNLKNRLTIALRAKRYVDITRITRKIDNTKDDIIDTKRELSIAKRSYANIRNFMNQMSDSD
jgi:hypothetical protein